MFGEDILLGQKEVSFDKKGRMTLPASTKREKDDEIIVIYDEDLDVHKIYNFKRFEEIFNDLSEKVMNSKSRKEKIYYKKELYTMGKSVLVNANVDTQGRILIGKIFEEMPQKVLTIGCKDHLVIQPIKKEK